VAALQGYARMVVLDERGVDLPTLKLAERLEGWMRAGGDTAFVIGGADGIDEALKRQADDAIRLSSLTLPHALARLILCEQLVSRDQHRPQAPLPSGGLMPVDLQHARLHLASRSPRRRELLTQIGVAFDSIVFRNSPRDDPELDETPLPGEDPVSYVATHRAQQGGTRLPHRPAGENCCRNRCWLPTPSSNSAGRLIGKPRRRRAMPGASCRPCPATRIGFSPPWRSPSPDASNWPCRSARCAFALSMHTRSPYVASGEPMDKAGAYAIQGRAGMFVEHLAGSYSGVMGLPLCETAQLLKRFGYRL
jgi:septum formation protein